MLSWYDTGFVVGIIGESVNYLFIVTDVTRGGAGAVRTTESLLNVLILDKSFGHG